MKPMLAFKFADHANKLTYPCHVQPKLNGVRMLYQAGFCVSRDGILWHPTMLQLIRETLESVHGKVVLDGELYKHGWSLQQINGAVSVNRIAPKPQTSQVEYHVFDCAFPMEPELSFMERRHRLLEISSLLVGPVKLVETHAISSASQADKLYTGYKDAGFEGMMYRESKSPYGFQELCGNKENRWKCLLKRKEWLDDEFEVVDFIRTTGAKGEAGFNLICQIGSQTFSVGSGLSDAELMAYSINPPIGQMARIRYEVLSDSGIPLKPTLEAIL
jgi:ATP-dependent DNA ligase